MPELPALSHAPEIPLPHHQSQPDEYRVLSVLNAVPLGALLLLELAGLRPPPEPGKPRPPVTEAHRALLRRLTQAGRMHWVRYGRDGCGYILTEPGTRYLNDNFERYGPAFAPRRGPALAELVQRR
ncbi:hypothetical protein, partial [Acinetobacter baumannii]|uniref:hypothetical protein n=1 Tax=Acinetobacter baumannii TaxID=470 RepID=UPI00227BFF65